ncbi:endo-1,4-beta-xylanase [Asticcacaulis sp. ZE23SCel15]|uniref:endo-1,4-beta-xylanase n=1 Tax=Asticcacaulis sp. ZE23SCel15 TaxID=3059027 RepID=UPI00265E0F0F|nr:endo-1,4-beta-xylanase [Asticcacaulis sp. ZE23SCel15]WKL57167.1 endo-1,4-beta-xylanase [Asticcacaulis sp. ZE23SCel15]
MSTLSRRQALTLMTAAAALPTSLSAQTNPSLAELAKAKGILFGSAVGAGNANALTGSFYDAKYLDILKRECAVLVPENEHKIYVIAAQPDKYNFEPGDRIAAFAKQNGMKLRGHTLFWNRVEFMPQWIKDHDFGPNPKKEAERFLRDYIKAVCEHYGTSVHSWDVVNETIDPQTGNIRETPFTKILGPEALRIAFEAAKEHAPHAQLVYNDYMSWEKGNETHRNGVLKLLRWFRDQNITVNGMGIQSHIGNDGHIDQVQDKDWKAFVDEIVGMDYDLLITEFDVNDKDLPTDPKVRDAAIAKAATRYLDMMLSYKQLKEFLCWGMCDKYTWLQGWTPRADKTLQRSTPYDVDYKPKLLREALAASFKNASPR